MDVLNVIDVREYERVLPNGKGILGQLTILERQSDGVKMGIVTIDVEMKKNL